MTQPDLEHLEYLRQLHEPFLAELEELAIQAIASGDWAPVHRCIGEFNGTLPRWTQEDYLEAKRFVAQLLQ